MEEEKMIEEMAKVLETKIVNKTWRSKSVAKELYRMIVPEGAVVLTRAEYKRLLDNLVGVDIEYLYNELAKARKETARGILKEIRENLKKSPKVVEWNVLKCEKDYGYYDKFVVELLHKIAKKYGVEIEG